MLNLFHISNFAIVPTLDLDFREGFTAITGETGAGKSILVDALGLLLGDRSDAAWVRSGAKRAELSAEFAVENNTPAQDWLTEADLDVGDRCLLRRTIDASGRSRAFINGSPVTVTQLQTLGRLLVEIHGQNQHLRLAKPTAQMRLLDGSGDYQPELKAVRVAHGAWKKTTEALQALQQTSSMSAADLEFLEFQLAELEQYDLSAEAIHSLQTEHDRLAAGDTLLEALNTGIHLMEHESPGGHPGINSSLNATLGHLQKFISLDTNIGDACQMLEEAAVNCTEATSSLRTARDLLNLDPERYAQVNARLSQINDLARKHQVNMEALGDTRDKLVARIQQHGHAGQIRQQLETELATRLATYRETASCLHQQRLRHALVLSDQVSGLMAELGMAGGVFALAVTLDQQTRPGSHGDDRVAINISTNPGIPPGPIQKIASGGELSRISLAIKIASIRQRLPITQIFDEVDAGIGGDTANEVGRLLKRLSGDSQVLCVTHLAQVAACADHQLQVRKASARSSTLVDTRLLDRNGRVEEIARMLSGRLSDRSRAHALELLGGAKPDS